MEKEELKTLLAAFKQGRIELADLLHRLEELPYLDLTFARLDTHRELRRGFPEVIFCPGKSTEQIAEITRALQEGTEPILATRATPEDFKAIQRVAPRARYHEAARLVIVGEKREIRSPGLILTVCAGTADIPVAEEAALTAEIMGNRVERLFDVGVAGIHRLLHHLDLLHKANVLIVAAGMDGALVSVISGLVDRPVIAVPVSSGYGTGFSGLAALLSMLNSCSPGVSTVNIDNGFGAGYQAALINQTMKEAEIKER